VFHYVAEQLKGVELFDSQAKGKIETGSIFNEFDACPSDMLNEDLVEQFCFSQSSNNSATLTTATDGAVESVKEAVDHAIMEEDRAVGVHAEHLTWETPLFDSETDIGEMEYMKKVYKLATDSEIGLDEITISKEAINMFERRLRTNWKGSDSVYDAWLLKKGLQRTSFDYHTFHSAFPDCNEKIEHKIDFGTTNTPVNITAISFSCSSSDSSSSTDSGSSTDTRSNTSTSTRSEIKKGDDEIVPDSDNDEIDNEAEETSPNKRRKTEDEDDKSLIKFIIEKAVSEIIVISSDEE